MCSSPYVTQCKYLVLAQRTGLTLGSPNPSFEPSAAVSALSQWHSALNPILDSCVAQRRNGPWACLGRLLLSSPYRCAKGDARRAVRVMRLWLCGIGYAFWGSGGLAVRGPSWDMGACRVLRGCLHPPYRALTLTLSLSMVRSAYSHPHPTSVNKHNFLDISGFGMDK